MTIRSKSLACWALVALLGTAHSLPAQTGSKPPKKPQRVEDPEARELNALLASAQAAMEKKEYAAAAQSYQLYLAKKPDDAFAHFQLGYACVALKQLEQARAEFEKATTLDPTMTEAHLNLGILLLDLDPPGAIAPLRRAAELKPGDPRPKFMLGWAYERTNNFPAAIEQYREVEQLNGQFSGIHLSLGRALLQTKNWSDAEAEFRAAIAAQPESDYAHRGLGQALLAQNKLEAAEVEFAKYLQMRPEDSGTRADHASVLADLGKNEEALAEIGRLPATEQERIGVLKLHARIYFHMKRYDDAAQILEKAAALAPQDADVPVQLGQVYLDKKDYPNAVRELIAAYKMNPGDNEVLGNLVAAEYLNKNYAAALEALDVLSKRRALPLGALFIRATCYDKLGQAAEALDSYQKFLAANPDETSEMYFQATARARFLARELKEKKR